MILTFFDVLGREVARRVSGMMEAGTHFAEWHPSAASGVYFYRIEAGSHNRKARSFVISGRMKLIR